MKDIVILVISLGFYLTILYLAFLLFCDGLWAAALLFMLICTLVRIKVTDDK